MFRKAFLVMTLGAILLAISCTQTDTQLPRYLQQQIALGEQVFQAKECGKCHTTDGTYTNGETHGPDLTSVFLAMDTLFVKTHLRFTELTAMPPIDMTPAEMSALVQYIAHLHAKAHFDSTLKNYDGLCPVCGAQLNKAEAAANHMVSKYQGKNYHFECADCKVVFERDPAWHSKSGYLLLTNASEWSEFK